MNRLQLKTDAKNAMREAHPHPVLVVLVYSIIVFAVQAILSMISGLGDLVATLITDGAQAAFALGLFVPLLILSLAGSLVLSFLQLGYVGYTLRVITRQPAGISDLFSYARYFLKAWGLGIMISIFVGLWSMLLWIPGIIASYRYSQAYFILAENPEKGIMQCIRESKAMMIGHKMDRFVLDLSFIPWYLLAIVTCGLGFIYVSPYTDITSAAFYRNLRDGSAQNGAQS